MRMPPILRTAMFAFGLATGVAAMSAANAKAAAQPKRVTASECKRYAEIQHIVTSGRVSVRSAYVTCQRKTKAHWLATPMTCSELGMTLCLVRACESGKRDKNNRGIAGTFDYRALNASGASGGYQYMPDTWGGTKGFARAMDAPPRVQDQRALRDVSRGGYSPWNESKGCWG